MKIAIFTDSYTPYVSGVVRSIQRFSAGLLKCGHQVYVFAPEYNRLTRPSKATEATRVFRFYSLPAPTCPDFSLPIPVSPRADRLVHRLGIDIIHTHSPFLMGKLGTILARRHGIPLFFTHHTLYHEYVHYIPAPRRISQQMVIKFLRNYCRRCDHIVAPTPEVARLIKGLYKLTVPITPIPTGIDLQPYESADQDYLRHRFDIPSTSQILLFVGRLGKEKNPQIILDAFSLLARRITDLHLVFVGDGPEKDRLEAVANDRDIGKTVHFTGVVDSTRVVDCYASADLFVFGSVTETQGLVTAEAMAAGLPVVAVNATGTNDTVTHGKDGYLTSNSAEDLAVHSEKLLTDPSLYRDMSKEALVTANALSIENTTQQLIAIYNQSLIRPRAPRPSLRRYLGRYS